MTITTPAFTSPPAHFVPADADCARWETIEPLAKALLERPVSTTNELEAWILDRGELEAAISEAGANLYISMTCDTEDRPAQAAYTAFVQDVQPRYKPIAFELDRRQADLTDRLGLPAAGGQRYEVLARAIKTEIELFRAENVPLQTELALLGQKYDQIAGAMTVRFEGEERTLPQMARYQEETDRGLRERAWRAVADRRLADKDAIDAIFDEMIRLRTRVAVNAGFPDYRGYAFRSMHRFDYGEHQCRDFHAAVEARVVPMVRRLQDQRRRTLGLDTLRPWDLAVDVKGRPPLRPFKDGRELFAKSLAVFRRLDPRLADMLGTMGDGSEARGSRGGASLDLDSRRGKAPGGYQYNRDRARRPFIFMNAAGLSGDVETMLHEAGHAFHSLLARDEPLYPYRSAPIEFCEVASMSMELLTLPHIAEFYTSPDDLARATRKQIERTVVLLPWIAQVDAFQFWLYANHDHTRDRRDEAFVELDGRFGAAVEWSGIEPVRRNLWQRQLHLFSHPFYYIEYGIAQLGALQLWLLSLEKGPAHAVDAYLRAMSLGGSRPLPDLFRAAGLTFDFGPSTVGRLVDRVEQELDRLPE
ncbi:MAG: M3 family oligoendopeptidase [Phycisphaeraceae bacterium]|nr:MAG: M3 family oligoendopeptidase [Phycisphaeraceae bacterium]